MFRIGEVVSYGTAGICTIEDIRFESLSRTGTKKQEYYILRPAASPTCTTYVPTANAVLTAKMRRLYSREQIDGMIDSVRGQKLAWIEDTRQRADVYGQIVSQGISSRLLMLIACLYLEKMTRSKSGRKLCATDEKILISAERMVSEEFSYALQIPQNRVAAYIADRIGEENA